MIEHQIYVTLNATPLILPQHNNLKPFSHCSGLCLKQQLNLGTSYID